MAYVTFYLKVVSSPDHLQCPQLLEFHIPKAFSAEEAPIGFTSVHHDAPYPRDKLQFPPALPNGLKAQPCALPNLPPTKEMLPVFVDPRTPTVMKDYFVPNTPAVHAHVSTFDDATVISLTIPHAVVDIQGVAILMRAWTAALNGELESVQHSPSTYAPFDTLAAAPDVPSSSSDNPWRGWFFLSIFSIIRWVIAFLWKNYSEGSGSAYNMWFPKEWLAQRKEECMAELKARGSDEWVGTNDVLMAAYYKVCLPPDHRNLAYPIYRLCIPVGATTHRSTSSVPSTCAAYSPATLQHTRTSTMASPTAQPYPSRLPNLAPSQSSKPPSPCVAPSTP